MPEYIAPGVFIEEVPFRAKPIEGVSTTTTGFVGPTRFGPIDVRPDIVTSLAEFERLYGGGGQLQYSDAGPMHNYLWHAARAFFTEGGKRLCIARTFLPKSGTDDGIARASVPASGGANALDLRARYPGAAGNIRVRLTIHVGQNVLGGETGAATVAGMQANDTVWIRAALPSAGTPSAGDLYLATWDEAEQTWRFGKSTAKSADDLLLNTTTIGSPSGTALDPGRGDRVCIARVTVSVLFTDGSVLICEDLSPDPAHLFGDTRDHLLARFSAESGCPTRARVPFVITAGDGVVNGVDVLNALFAANSTLRLALSDANSTDSQRSVDVLLAGGNDGARPTAGEYAGHEDPVTALKTGLKAFEAIDEISLVAAPGSTFGFGATFQVGAAAIAGELIAHAERARYRFAVLDSGDGLDTAKVRAMRAAYDSKDAALYYPWLQVLDPMTRQEISLPPSGFVCGIYARNATACSLTKAPANEAVKWAIGLETMLNAAQQAVLNPEGINCFRVLPGGGIQLWGGRTVSSDPDWKYVNLRRFFAYLEHSIERGTQWAVFEPNGDALWARVRRTIEDFLLNEWQAGALLGDKPEQAFFVRCDRSTMDQNDLDNGRLVCLIGVAPLQPAEFVIFRIGQWTADAKCRDCR